MMLEQSSRGKTSIGDLEGAKPLQNRRHHEGFKGIEPLNEGRNRVTRFEC